MRSSDPQDRRHWFPVVEAGVVFSLILLYIWRLRLYLPSSWVGILALIVLSHIWRKETPASLGFRRGNLANSLTKFSPFLLLLTLALLTAGFVFRTIRNLTWDSAFFSLAFYCLWGLFQQYLLNGYFANRFLEFSPGEASDRVPVLAAVLFGAAHLPNWFLMLVALSGGYLCVKVYLRYRNLYFLGLAHGIVGFLLYLVVPDSISHHLYVGPKWFSP